MLQQYVLIYLFLIFKKISTIKQLIYRTGTNMLKQEITVLSLDDIHIKTNVVDLCRSSRDRSGSRVGECCGRQSRQAHMYGVRQPDPERESLFFVLLFIYSHKADCIKYYDKAAVLKAVFSTIIITATVIQMLFRCYNYNRSFQIFFQAIRQFDNSFRPIQVHPRNNVKGDDQFRKYYNNFLNLGVETTLLLSIPPRLRPQAHFCG